MAAKKKKKTEKFTIESDLNLFTNSSIYSYITAFIHSYYIFP